MKRGISIAEARQKYLGDEKRGHRHRWGKEYLGGIDFTATGYNFVLTRSCECGAILKVREGEVRRPTKGRKVVKP